MYKPEIISNDKPNIFPYTIIGTSSLYEKYDFGWQKGRGKVILDSEDIYRTYAAEIPGIVYSTHIETSKKVLEIATEIPTAPPELIDLIKNTYLTNHNFYVLENGKIFLGWLMAKVKDNIPRYIKYIERLEYYRSLGG